MIVNRRDRYRSVGNAFRRYTCIEPLKRYRYKSIDSDFTRDIEVDRRGLVVTYPGLFRRLS